MPKKKTSKSTKHQSFKLSGSHDTKTVAICLIADLLIGIVLGILLQPTIVALITAYAADLPIK